MKRTNENELPLWRRVGMIVTGILTVGAVLGGMIAFYIVFTDDGPVYPRRTFDPLAVTLQGGLPKVCEEMRAEYPTLDKYVAAMNRRDTREWQSAEETRWEEAYETGRGFRLTEDDIIDARRYILTYCWQER